MNAEELIQRTQVMMGTYASISLSKENLAQSTAVFKRLKAVELALSSYDKNAQIYKLNHKGELALSLDTFEALVLCKQYYSQTDGYFDITVGSITKGLFHFGEDERLPKSDELNEAKLNFKGLHFTQERAWVEEGIVLDLGGMGKGFGVDKAVKSLKGVNQAVVALSGDIYCIGACEMAIQNPFEKAVLATFTMKDMAISTSGNYNRYVKASKYNHLINPKKKESQRTFASMTLISSTYTNSDLDAYATAASVMPYAKALQFLAKMKIEYLLVKTDKSVVLSRSFKQSVSDFNLSLCEKKPKREYLKALPLKFQNSKTLGL